MFGYDPLDRALDNIRGNRGAEIGGKSLRRLRGFIEGYTAAVKDAEIEDRYVSTALLPLGVGHMTGFVKMKLRKELGLGVWETLIIMECRGNDGLAFDRFFDYLTELRALKAVGMRKAMLSEENIRANDEMLHSFRTDPHSGEHLPVYDSPRAVYLIKLSGVDGELLAVETDKEIILDRSFVIKGSPMYRESLHPVFGHITGFEEIPCAENPDFGKPVKT